MPLIELDNQVQGAEPERRGESQDIGGMITYSLLRSRWSIFWMALLGVLLGFVYGASRPNLYQAMGKLHLRTGVREATTVETVIGIEQRANSGRGDAIATELHILNNPKLIDAVIEKVGADRLMTMPDPTVGDDESTSVPVRLLHRFQAWWFGGGPPADMDPGLKVTVARTILQTGLRISATQSSVFEVFYVASDPVLASDVVNTYLEAAEEHHRSVFNVNESYTMIQDRQMDAMAQCNVANTSLAEFRDKNGLYDFETQKTALIEEIRTLERDLAEHALQSESLQAQLQFIEAELKMVDTTSADSRTVNPVTARLQTELSDLRDRKLDAAPRNTETEENFQKRLARYDALIEQVEKELANHPPFLVQPNPRKVQLLTQRDQARVELVAITATFEDRRKRLQEQRKDLLRLRRLEPQYDQLVLQANQCEQRVLQSTRVREQVGRMLDLDREKLGNLKTLQQARVPETKMSPSRSKFLVLGALLGIIGGALLAFVRTALAPVVVRATDLAKHAGVPVLAVVSDRRFSGAKARGAIMQGVAGRSPLQGLIDNLWSRILPQSRPIGQIKIGFVATSAGQGCSTVAAAAGLGLALRTRQPVLVIETAFDTPGLARAFGVEDGPGLSEVLAGEANLEDAIQETEIPGLSVLCAGNGPRPEPGTFATPETAKVLSRATECCQFALFDLAPIDEDPDTRVLLWDVDSVVGVVRSRKTRKDAVQALAGTVRARGTNMIGCVLNRFRSVRPFWIPGVDPELKA